MKIVCECDSFECQQKIDLPEADIERLILNTTGVPRNAIVLPEHRRPEEKILEEGNGWVVVEDTP